MTRFNFTFQENSPLISYSRGWREGGSDDPQAGKYDGSFRVSQVGGSTASFKFNGSAVSISGAARANHGNYTVTLDQQPSFSAVGNLTKEVFNRTLWGAANLEYSQHTVTVTNVPTTSTHTFFDLDFVTIERHIGKDGDSTFHAELDDTAPSIQYTGTWEELNGISTAHNGTLHTTSDGDSRAVITFFGCCVEIYGQYANALYSVSLDNQIPINMQGLDVDLPPGMRHPQTLLYMVDGLSETGNHTVTLTNTNSDVNRPFTFDYAVMRSTHNITADLNSLKPSGSQNNTTVSSLSGKPSMPMGIIVAATVCATLFILALLLFAFLLVLRRRRKADKRALRIELDPDEPGPDPLVSPFDVESFRSRSAPRISADPTEPEMAYCPRSSYHSQEGLLSPEEQYAAETSSISQGSSSSYTITTNATRASTYKGRPVLLKMLTRPAARERDAGVIIEPDHKPVVAAPLPPAYNSEWHRRRTQDFREK